jgi:hypothetical protein
LNLDNGIGYLLIFCGLGAALGILLEIYALFVDPQQLVTFKQLFPEQLTISWTDGLITVPAEVLAYLLPLLLLSMAGGIASSLINAGTGLIRKR